MNDSVRVTNLPDSGSRERVALDLMKMIRQTSQEPAVGKDALLLLYAECLNVTRGNWPDT